MGLGSTAQVSLREAREGAEKRRAKVRDNQDPIKARARERRESARNLHVLNDVADDAFESRTAELKGDGRARRWFSPLRLYVLPKLGKVAVADIGQNAIRDVLAPIWHTKADTARKALNHFGICLWSAKGNTESIF